MDFGIKGLNYITLRKLKYNDIVVPKGFEFDGVTLKAPFTIIFSTDDLMKGIYASCFHDYMCKNRQNYTLKYSTDVLVKLWKEEGLNPFKCFLVKTFVNIFQFFRGGWKKV